MELFFNNYDVIRAGRKTLETYSCGWKREKRVEKPPIETTFTKCEKSELCLSIFSASLWLQENFLVRAKIADLSKMWSERHIQDFPTNYNKPCLVLNNNNNSNNNININIATFRIFMSKFYWNRPSEQKVVLYLSSPWLQSRETLILYILTSFWVLAQLKAC